MARDSFFNCIAFPHAGTSTLSYVRYTSCDKVLLLLRARRDVTGDDGILGRMGIRMLQYGASAIGAPCTASCIVGRGWDKSSI